MSKHENIYEFRVRYIIIAETISNYFYKIFE